ncbi:sugar phosphate isomerase/epimerase family protein [Natrarchaeobaculum sulfurireducens]|uniref:Sugar phosphate isomerase/epimerase n=1 Tax=Natrarchaeobaculum sulfurireducens TaxID=2044521 RepID=A0A346PCV2_9EURY|nr:sugar phosphate isomerase/epimerase [Natrarchaeobaculum sulfurireducens]AXR77347.1 Sugar phosphate isomerase/epimerase [Natrarchaeobaculum sulfurireducens]
MDIGVHTPPLYDRSFEDALEFLADRGVSAVEPGVGGYPGDDHLERNRYLDDESAQESLKETLADHDMRISALATHNNPLHPDEDEAETADTELREAIRLTAQLEVGTVTCFSGLPAGGPDDEVPNWITAPWPPEHAEALEYQWERATEYWSNLAAFADEHDVDLAIEMHPNMLVYEPAGLLRLREVTNDRVGANFDPSHLYWQGIDVTDAIRFLGSDGAIHHVHAKDTQIYDEQARIKGVLDTTAYDDELHRSWLFRSVGYGHGEDHWKDVVSTLRMVGYDDVLSIEHEDSLTSSIEGLEKAIDCLQRAVFRETPGEAYWTE